MDQYNRNKPKLGLLAGASCITVKAKEEWFLSKSAHNFGKEKYIVIIRNFKSDI